MPPCCKVIEKFAIDCCPVWLKLPDGPALACPGTASKEEVEAGSSSVLPPYLIVSP